MRIDDHCDWGAALTLFFLLQNVIIAHEALLKEWKLFFTRKKKNKKLTFLNYPPKINGKKINFSNKSNDNLGSCKKICVVHKHFSLYIC